MEIIIQQLYIPTPYLYHRIHKKISFPENETRTAVTSPKYEITKSSHQRCFVKKNVLKNIAKITGKHLLIKRLSFKKETPKHVFSSGIFKIFKSTFFTEHLRVNTSVIIKNTNINVKHWSREVMFLRYSS